MRNKKRILKDISLVVLSNGVTMVTSMITTVILPKFIGVTSFSYWQLYMFYAAYVIYLQLGWLEGIYLKEGGNSYCDLDFSKYSCQFRLLLLWGSIVGFAIYLITVISNISNEKKEIFSFIAVYVVIIFLRTFVSYIFQATGKIKEYAIINIIDRIVFLVGSIGIIFAGINNYSRLIELELFAKLTSLVLGIYFGKKLVFTKPCQVKKQSNDMFDNIRVGSKLMLATVAGLLINGIVRFGIEQHWNIETFGRVSFTISLSNIVITFIGAVSVVFFPLLRNIKEKEKLMQLYENMNNLLTVFSFAILIFYLPLKVVANMWLPEYESSIYYMALICPICFFESKMSIINITYLKALRKENIILLVNLISIVVSAIMTTIAIQFFDNLTMTIFILLIISIFKCELSSYFLKKELPIEFERFIFQELILTIAFVFSNWRWGGYRGFFLYIICYIVFCILNFNRLKKTMRFLLEK